jgi:1-acyl-sn-glycerol-3-phosphate acyltransferase
MAGSRIRSAILLVFRRIARIYFREIEVAGDVPSASTGGRLFAANHVNGLVDPILVLTQTPCGISPVAKSTLWSIPGLKWLLESVEAVPIVRRRDVPGKSESDNEAVFARVASHLAEGGNILIFPEGTSHNEPHLLSLRSGAGRMLGRASAEPGAAGLTFQAVALEFDDREVFRSRSLVLFGAVRRVSDMPGVDLAKEITDVIQADLSELLVEGSTWEERITIVRVAEMFAKEADDGSLEHRNRVGRRIENARRILSKSAPDEVRAIEERLRAYVARLDAEETSDEAVARVARGTASGLDEGRALRAAAMIVTLPVALLAVLIYWLPYQLPRFVTRKLKGDPDVSSTYKLGVGLVVYPVWATAAIVLAFLRLPSIELGLLATLVILACPFAALAWLDRWDRLSTRMSMLAPSEERRERLAELAVVRSSLLQELRALSEKLEDAAAGGSDLPDGRGLEHERPEGVESVA